MVQAIKFSNGDDENDILSRIRNSIGQKQPTQPLAPTPLRAPSVVAPIAPKINPIQPIRPTVAQPQPAAPVMAQPVLRSPLVPNLQPTTLQAPAIQAPIIKPTFNAPTLQPIKVATPVVKNDYNPVMDFATNYLNPFGSKGIFGAESIAENTKNIQNAGQAYRDVVDSALGEKGDGEFNSWKDVVRFGANLVPGMAEGFLQYPKDTREAITGERLNLNPQDQFTGDTTKLDTAQRVGAGANAVLEAFGLGLGGSSTLLKSIFRWTTKEVAESFVKKLFKDMLTEGTEEGVQSLMTDLQTTGYFDEGTLERMFQSAVLGTAGGGLMSGAGKVVSAVKTGAANIAEQQANMTPNQVKRAGEGGYINIPSKIGAPEADYRGEIKNKIANEALNFTQNEATIKAGYAANGNSKTFTETKALFKEFQKNPDKFIDKYGLLPDEYKKTEVSGKSATSAEPTPIADTGMTTDVPIKNEQVQPAIVEPSKETVTNEKVADIIEKPVSTAKVTKDLGKADIMTESEKRINQGLKELSNIRKQYSSDQEFFDKVILENQDAEGEIGDFARHIARRDATEGSIYNKNYLTEILDDELSPLNSKLDKSIAQSANRDALAKSIRDLEKSTGQKGLWSKVADNMRDMNEAQQIEYMSKAMKQARDSGILAADFINKQNGYAPNTKATPKTQQTISQPKPELPAPKDLEKTEVPQVTKTEKKTPVLPEKTEVAETLAPKRKYAKKTPQTKLAPAGSMETAKTGTIGKSKGKASKGQLYAQTSQAASRGRGIIEAEKTNFNDFMDNIKEKGTIEAVDHDTAVELQKQYEPGTAEHRLLGDIANKVRTNAAQIMSIIERTVRKTSSARQLTDRFANKVYKKLDDDRSVSADDLAKNEEANQRFEKARTLKQKLHDKFQADPSVENMQAYEKAHEEYVKADVASLFEEYNTLAKAIERGGTDNTDAKQYLEKLKENSGIYFMDYIDTNMLSSTRTMLNNYINSMTVGLEESAFGKAGSAFARAIVPSSNIGGGSSAGRKLGKKLGTQQVMTEAALRNKAAGNKFLNMLSNVVTTGNTLGDRNISSAAYQAVYDTYRNELKQKGYTGKELENRTRVMSLEDPSGIVEDAKAQAMVNMGLAGALNVNHKAKMKVETLIADQMAGSLSSYIGAKPAKLAAKAITRATIGYPTVAIRSAVGGAKRATLGTSSLLQAGVNMLKKNSDPEVTAMHLKNSVKEFGSGATMMAIGAAAASQGLLSGAYPDDQDERDAWKREGKSEYSIKLGNDWYNLPQALGVFALPFMIGANGMDKFKETGNLGDVANDLVPTAFKTLLNLTPLDQLNSTIKLLQDPTENAVAGIGSSLTRAMTPVGSFVNQLAKAFDPTANDTTKGDALNQFVSKVRDGVPFLNQGLPDKEVEGNVITNPSPVARFLGAVSTEQKAGVARSTEISDQIKEVHSQLKDYGVFSDNIRNVLDDENKVLFDKARNGKDVDASDNKKLLASIAKGVNETSDTRFLEDGDYDSNLAVLKVKRDILSADKTTTKSTLDNYDTQIKRGEVYKKLKTPYELISQYSKVGLDDWRKMGTPPGAKGYDADLYDEKMYQALYALDTELKNVGASRNSKGSDKNKYSVKDTSASSAASVKANTKASAKAMLSAISDQPTPTLPKKPTISAAEYKRVPINVYSKSAATNKYAPIKISAKSARSKQDRSMKNVL